MALLHEFSFIVMPIIVCVSLLAGRVSLRPKHFTGWYETYHDIKTLTSLFLCSTLFFTSSVLLTVLLFFSPQPKYYEANLKNGTLILLIYLFAVVVPFCLPRMRDWRRRSRSKKLKRKQGSPLTLAEGDASAASANAGKPCDLDEQPDAPEESDTNGDISVRKDILQFVCVFSTSLFIQFFLVLLFLYGYCLKESGNWSLNLWALLSGSSLNVISTYNCDLFIFVLLLVLTSGTGGLLATMGVDYRKDGEQAVTCRIRDQSRTHLNELVKLIRSR